MDNLVVCTENAAVWQRVDWSALLTIASCSRGALSKSWTNLWLTPPRSSTTYLKISDNFVALAILMILSLFSRYGQRFMELCHSAITSHFCRGRAGLLMSSGSWILLRDLKAQRSRRFALRIAVVNNVLSLYTARRPRHRTKAHLSTPPLVVLKLDRGLRSLISRVGILTN
jgi:hypothetical protein